MARKTKSAGAGTVEPPVRQPDRQPNSSASLPAPPRDGNPWILYAAIVAAVLFIFGQTAGFGVVELDDSSFTTENFVVANGLSWAGLHYAFASFQMGSWHPLTWISHMLDSSLFGGALGSHHMVNVLLHAVNSLLVFYLLRRMTGAHWRSAIVAILFAIHPMHVEAVAWLADRKGLLSAFFWLLAVYFWVRYIGEDRRKWYAWSLAAFACGLLSKPTVVTLPFALVLIELWPLGRWREWSELPARLAGKAPFFALSAIVAAVTVWGQRQAGAMDLYGSLPLASRLLNALYGIGMYLIKTLAPVNLIVNPIVEANPPIAVVALGAVAATAGVFFAVRAIRDRPWFTMGWLWFLGVLVPVLGLIQTGDQAWADRYSYVPHIGLFVALVWGVAAAIPEPVKGTTALKAALILAGCVMAYASNIQTGYWRDGRTLFSRVVEVDPRHVQGQQLLGRVRIREGRFAEADQHLKKAVELRPKAPDSYLFLAESQFAQGKTEDALATTDKALALDPINQNAHFNRGRILQKLDRSEDAIRAYERAIGIGLLPDRRLEAHFEIGRIKIRNGDTRGAEASFQNALAVDPFHYLSRKNYAFALFRQQRWDEAKREFDVLYRVNEKDEDVVRSLGFLYNRKK